MRKKTNEAQRAAIASDLAAARNEKLTPERRKEIASSAAKARWAKAGAKKKAKKKP